MAPQAALPGRGLALLGGGVEGAAKERNSQLVFGKGRPPTTEELTHAHSPAADLFLRGRC